jgi:hypothetical protein
MIDYRARATQAEQENARLRAELARKPNFAWFVSQIRAMLSIENGAPINDIIAKVKVLKENQELYKAGNGTRKISKQEKDAVFKEGIIEGRRLERERILETLS